MRVLVVGSGIVGASTAFHLTRLGAQVVVVDQGLAGQATMAGAGIVFPYPQAGHSSALRPLVHHTLEHWASVVDPLGVGIASTDIVYASDDAAELDELLAQLAEIGAEPGLEPAARACRLKPAEVTDLIPVLRDNLPGIGVPGARRVDGQLLTGHLLAQAEAAGATVRAGTATFDDTAGVSVGGEPVTADAVVVAAGAWSAELCAPLGVRLPVRPVRGQILHLDSSLADTERWPLFRRIGRHYLLGFPDGRVVSGALHEPLAGFVYRRTASGVAQLLDDALDTAPGLAGSSFAEVRVGFRPGGTDGRPTIGRLERHPQVVVATGLGAEGLTYGPYLGAVAADLALGREPAADLDTFRPDRAGQAR